MHGARRCGDGCLRRWWRPRPPMGADEGDVRGTPRATGVAGPEVTCAGADDIDRSSSRSGSVVPSVRSPTQRLLGDDVAPPTDGRGLSEPTLKRSLPGVRPAASLPSHRGRSQGRSEPAPQLSSWRRPRAGGSGRPRARGSAGRRQCSSDARCPCRAGCARAPLGISAPRPDREAR
jgi:hypothetical protein